MRSGAGAADAAVSMDGGAAILTGPCETEALWCLRWLSQPGIGAATVRRLVGRFGSPGCAARASAASLVDAIGGDPARIEATLARIRGDASGRDALGELERTRAAGARHLVFGSADYPELLAASADPPALLAVRGALGAAPEPTVAIVGSRRATTYGRLAAGRIASALAERGVVVVSGGARGIDAEAHRGTLRAGGRTIAVIATGLGHAYPPEHRGLYEEIVAAGGAIVTEQPYAVEARPELFPRRNRIVAGLSIVTVVVEAAARSGALLTARLAVEDDGRDAGCVPGPIDQPQSEGCHRAIREGWAHLVTGADDIVALLEAGRSLVAGAVERSARWRKSSISGPGDPVGPVRAANPPSARVDGVRPPASRPSPASGAADPNASGDEACVLRILAREPLGMDGLEAALEWPVPRIANALLRAEMSGLLERSASGLYRRTGGARRPVG